MSHDIFEGEWKQLKGSIQMMWADITDDELEKVKGERQRFEGLLQEKYGHSVELSHQLTDRLLDNHDQFGGAWDAVKGELKTFWGDLTGDEVGRLDGRLESLVGLVRMKYGKEAQDARKDVHRFLDSIDFESVRKTHGNPPSASA